jgi:hypothetical protein
MNSLTPIVPLTESQRRTASDLAHELEIRGHELNAFICLLRKAHEGPWDDFEDTIEGLVNYAEWFKSDLSDTEDAAQAFARDMTVEQWRANQKELDAELARQEEGGSS